MTKILYKEAKEVLGNAMDYTRARVNQMRDKFENDTSILHTSMKHFSKGLNKIEERLDKVEQILDEYHIGRAQDVLGELPIQGDREQDIYIKAISPYSKAFMQGIIDQCDIDDCDGVEIVIYKHGKRVRSYEYDKTI